MICSPASDCSAVGPAPAVVAGAGPLALLCLRSGVWTKRGRGRTPCQPHSWDPKVKCDAKLEVPSRAFSRSALSYAGCGYARHTSSPCETGHNAQRPKPGNHGGYHSNVGRKHILRGLSEGCHAKGVQLQRKSQAEPLCPRLHLGCSWDHRMVLCQNHTMLEINHLQALRHQCPC